MPERSPEVAASGILTSRIGRRFVALFLGCALVPLLLFAWITLSKVSQQMNTDMRERLHNGAKTTGMGIAARLSQVAADLALIAELVQQNGESVRHGRQLPIQEHIAERCAALWIVDGARTLPLRGDAVLPLPSLRATDRVHLAAGKPLLRVLGTPAQLVMIRAVDQTDPASPLLVATLQGKRFWEPEELRTPLAEFLVLDESGKPLSNSFRRLTNLDVLLSAVRTEPSSGTVEWIADDEPHVARYWRAFLRPQYDLDLLVVQSQSRRTAFQVADAFVQWFLLTALCTLLCVLFASLVQMRRTLGPIVSLNDATRRVAMGDLGARVSIKSRDEFGELGKAFNHMTAQMQESVRRREQTERELTASRDQALAAARAKAEFVTNVSHEFRTPMTEILGATEILAEMDEADAASRAEFTKIACSGAKRLASLIDDVLELGSTTALILEPVDIAASLMQAIGATSAVLMSRVRTDIADDLPLVMGEANRLREAWCRLLDNAGKFSAPDSPIEIRARFCGEVVVEFVDQGVGISRLDVDRIFEPFSQVGRDQMTDKAHGTGLGLTLARRAVERHGGRIEVESELGNGATFRVYLPAAADVPAHV